MQYRKIFCSLSRSLLTVLQNLLTKSESLLTRLYNLLTSLQTLEKVMFQSLFQFYNLMLLLIKILYIKD